MSDIARGIVVRIPDKDTASYTWTIEKFCLCCLINWQSPTFNAKINGNEHTWQLRAINSTMNKRIALSFALDSYSKYNTNVDICAAFSIVNDKGELTNTKKIESAFTERQKVSAPTYIEHSCLTNPCKLIPGGVLTILFEIASKHVDTNLKFRQQLSNQDLSLLDDLQLTFNNQKFSDLTLVVGEQEIHVHKVILASKSPVFAAMLESDMAEKASNKVEIDDIDYETMKHALLYIYTGKVVNLELASKLLRPADKYALDGLKNICADVLSEALTVENVVEILSMAEFYRVSKLKNEAIAFMAEHFLDVTKTEGFESLLKSNSHLFTAS